MANFLLRAIAASLGVLRVTSLLTLIDWKAAMIQMPAISILLQHATMAAVIIVVMGALILRHPILILRQPSTMVPVVLIRTGLHFQLPVTKARR